MQEKNIDTSNITHDYSFIGPEFYSETRDFINFFDEKSELISKKSKNQKKDDNVEIDIDQTSKYKNSKVIQVLNDYLYKMYLLSPLDEKITIEQIETYSKKIKTKYVVDNKEFEFDCKFKDYYEFMNIIYVNELTTFEKLDSYINENFNLFKTNTFLNSYLTLINNSDKGNIKQHYSRLFNYIKSIHSYKHLVSFNLLTLYKAIDFENLSQSKDFVKIISFHSIPENRTTFVVNSIDSIGTLKYKFLNVTTEKQKLEEIQNQKDIKHKQEIEKIQKEREVEQQEIERIQKEREVEQQLLKQKLMEEQKRIEEEHLKKVELSKEIKNIKINIDIHKDEKYLKLKKEFDITKNYEILVDYFDKNFNKLHQQFIQSNNSNDNDLLI